MSPMDAIKSITAMFNKDVRALLMLIVGTAWLTIWVGVRIRDVEKSLIKMFAERDKEIEVIKDDLKDARAEAWTIHMMAARDRIIAEKNPTNWIPDSMRIFYDVRANREPTGLRVTP